MWKINTLYLLLLLFCANPVFGQIRCKEKFSMLGAIGGGGYNFPKDSIITERAIKHLLLVRLGAAYSFNEKFSVGIATTRAFNWGNAWPEEVKRNPYLDITLFLYKTQKIQIFKKYFKDRYVPPIQYNHLLLFTAFNQYEDNGKLISGGIGLRNAVGYLPTFEIRVLPRLNAYYTPFVFLYYFNTKQLRIENRPTLHLRYFFYDAGKSTLVRDDRKPIGKLRLDRQAIQKNHLKNTMMRIITACLLLMMGNCYLNAQIVLKPKHHRHTFLSILLHYSRYRNRIC